MALLGSLCLPATLCALPSSLILAIGCIMKTSRKHPRSQRTLQDRHRTAMQFTMM